MIIQLCRTAGPGGNCEEPHSRRGSVGRGWGTSFHPGLSSHVWQIPTLARRAGVGLALVGMIHLGISARGDESRDPSPPARPRGSAVLERPSAAANVPPPEWLLERRSQQIRAAARYKTEHDFNFTDRWAESGIRFQHHVVEDAGKHFKPVHYDHGTGLAVADVDGDGLPDLYFVNQLGGNELWRNLGNGRFENITEAAGVGLKDRIGVAASFADIDNDGDPDLFVTTVRGGNALFENLGHGRFKDISHEAGLDYVGHSSGAVFFDFDNDGLVDLFVCNVGRYTTDKKGPGGYYIGIDGAFRAHTDPQRAEQSILYRNLGGNKFKDVSKAMNLQDLSWSGDATFVDLNEDGFADLYVLNMQGDDHFYENVEGKRFVEKTATYFPKTPWGAMGVKFFDFNQDGRMDLFVTDMHSDMTDRQIALSRKDFSPLFERQKTEAWCTAQWNEAVLQGSSNNIFGNAFYLNQGQGRFLEVSDQIGAEVFWPWGVSVGDLNADGFEDAFITTGLGLGYRYTANALLLNEGGKRFVPSEFVVGVEPRLHGRTEKLAFVLDCAGEDKDNPYCANATGQLGIGESLSSRSSAIVDLDGDGDLDIVTNEMNDRPQVLISTLAQRQRIHFLKIQLSGARSNRQGLGATVKVHLGARTLTQFSDGKSGYLSQSSLPLYFGLGDAERIDSVEIRWPSGARQVIDKDIAINKLMTIQETP